MIYLCEHIKNGIRIRRVFGYDDILELPNQLLGEAVTELGAYIFSDRMDREDLEKALQEGILCTEEGKKISNVDNFLEISGEKLREIVLPESIQKVGRYAFYNCRRLSKLSFGGGLRDLGAGALTGCHHVTGLSVILGKNGESCLREILTELPETLSVDIERNGEKGCFWFPEFFEEGVENTPARILENHVHGSGIRYRNCFQNRVLNIGEYDKIFPHAIAWEDENSVLKLALSRILYPMELTEKMEKIYLDYLNIHVKEAVKLLGEQKNYEAMSRILDKMKPDREAMEWMLETAQIYEDSRWTGILMAELERFGKKKRRSFDL